VPLVKEKWAKGILIAPVQGPGEKAIMTCNQSGLGAVWLCQRPVGIDVASAVAGINKLRTTVI